PDTSQWFSQEVHEEEPSQQNVVPVPTHSLEVTVLDPNGAPMGDIPISLSTSFLSNIRVNGLSYQTSAVDALELRTDANGRLVILQRANSLAAATIFLTTPYVQDGQPIQVEPNAQLQDKLRGMKAEDILNAKDASDNYLLKGDLRTQANAESIANITQQSMELGKGSQEAAPIMYLSTSRHRRGWDPRIHFAAVNTQSWEIDFESGFPVYKAMTAQDVDLWRSGVMAELQDNGIGDFLKSAWGKIWNGIKEGAEWLWNGLKKIIVEKIINPISGLVEKVKVFFHMVIDGITHVFESLLEFVQQAFDFIEGVWNWIKVKLKELYEWLAFFFNWADIKRTAEAVEHAVNTTLDFSVLIVQHYRSVVENGFEAFKKKIDQGVDEFLSKLNGEPTLGNYGTDYTNKDQDKNQAADHNPLLNAFTQNGDKGTATPGPAALARAGLPESIVESLEGVFDKIKNYADNFQFGDAKTAFDEAYTYFTQIGDTPSNVLKKLISGIIKVAEGLALVAIDIAEGIVLSLFDAIVDIIQAFKDSLNEIWEIPIVSQIYKWITGKELGFKPLVLMSYVAGIPGTLMYKLIFNEAPFKDNEELDNFKANFSVAWLSERAGIASAAAASVAISEETRLKMKKVFLSIRCGNTFIRMFIDGITAFNIARSGSADGGGDGGGQTNWDKAGAYLKQHNRKFSMAAILTRYLTGVLTIPWVLTKDAGGPGCDVGKPEFGVTIWICQMIFGPTRGLVFWFITMAKSTRKVMAYVGEFSLCAWGVAHIIMASLHFAEASKQGDKHAKKVAFARAMSLMIPAQFMRPLDLPGFNKGDYMIPLIILEVSIGVGYLTSFGCNIAEAKMVDDEQKNGPSSGPEFYII
ncbi:MAG: Ig-like domain-containing protein, partial [Phaeodactylibacter sp.]|nr:Ig-like domain-containing protein [Phaeodactylibacter sp.]